MSYEGPLGASLIKPSSKLRLPMDDHNKVMDPIFRLNELHHDSDGSLVMQKSKLNFAHLYLNGGVVNFCCFLLVLLIEISTYFLMSIPFVIKVVIRLILLTCIGSLVLNKAAKKAAVPTAMRQ